MCIELAAEMATSSNVKKQKSYGFTVSPAVQPAVQPAGQPAGQPAAQPAFEALRELPVKSGCTFSRISNQNMKYVL